MTHAGSADDLAIVFNVLVIDVDSATREAIGTAVRDEASTKVVGSASTGSAAFALASHESVDVIVLGTLALSDVPVLELVPALRAAAPYARLVLFGWPASTPVAALADAVVASTSGDELRAAVRALTVGLGSRDDVPRPAGDTPRD